MPGFSARPDTATVSGFWWDRSGDSRAGELEAVVVSLDRALESDCAVIRDLVWDLHCAGVRVAAITSGRGAAVQRAVRGLLGDGAVEFVLTGDDVGGGKADPEIYHLALWELGVRAERALAVEDSLDGMEAALDAGLAAVLTDESMSVHRCRRVRKRWLTGALSA